MEVKITISDDSKFNEVIQRELDAFSPQELHDIVGQAVLQYLSDKANTKELFFKEITDNWGYTKIEKTAFFEKLIPKDANDITVEVREAITAKLKETLCSDEKIQEMIREVWVSNLADTLANNLMSNWTLKNLVQQVLAEIRNPQQV
jgi:hypothetical protein